MTIDFDKEFGPGGCYAWPAGLNEAEIVLGGAPYTKSSAECLDDDERFDQLDEYLFDEYFSDYPEEEAYELAEAEAKSRQELFKDARDWPLPDLVASAVYKILSPQRIHSQFWNQFLWPFLSFAEPLFDMLRAKGWDNMYRNELREGFKSRLSLEIHGIAGIRDITGNLIVWGSDKDEPKDIDVKISPDTSILKTFSDVLT